jgi:CDP-diacylglycerol--inositol 3-phosphatidyltransferase
MSKNEMNINILLFLPNLIDYARLILTVVSFNYAKTHPEIFLFLYFLSYLLDEFDGLLARRYDQTSNFGAILDMIIDRISTNGLLAMLAIFYSDLFYIFIILMMLDIGSHWLQTHSALLVSKTNNHKFLEEPFKLLTIYYRSRLALCIIGWLAEIFLAQIYYIHFYKDAYLSQMFVHLLYISLPFYLLKQIISVLQIIAASDRIIQYDLKEREVYSSRSIIN